MTKLTQIAIFTMQMYQLQNQWDAWGTKDGIL